MDVSKRLTTQQLHSVAEALQYVELSIGNTVYKCGEEGSAAYFILSGRVRLFNGQERSTTTIKSPLTSLTDDFWSIDLCEGDVFGTEALTGDSRRLTTALAVGGVTGDTPVRLGLTRLQPKSEVFYSNSTFEATQTINAKSLESCRIPNYAKSTALDVNTSPRV
ncbi:hypothetical protein PF003_g5479 [Phytophthora fragariae]|nr:hypothetical protein PF003_g5479 [Phytophthora fragariae]